MFLAQAGDPESSKYCLLFCFRFPAAPAEALAAAFEKVAAATPALRSHYALEDGEPVRVDDGAVPAVEIRDAADFAAVKAALAALPHQRDLSVTPVKAVVFRLADESVLGLSTHHVAFDGGGAVAFVKSIESVLAGGEPLAQPADNALPAPPESATALYDGMFSSGVPVCEMPTKVARPKEHPFEDRELTLSWTPDEFAALVDAAHRLSVSAFELVFSAVGAVVAKYCASEDVVLGTQINSRDAAHKDAIGMFVNTGVVRLRPVRTDSFDDYVKASAALVRRVNHGEALPFSDVLSRYGVQTDPSRNPMFDVAVNWLPPQPERLYRVPSKESGAEKRARDLTLTFTRTKTDLSLLVSWPDALLDETLVANFAAQLKATLSYATRTPGDPLSVRDALALPDDQREALAKFSETASAAPTETLLHKMFEKAAKANPSKIALVAVDRTLTFAELDAEADDVSYEYERNDLYETVPNHVPETPSETECEVVLVADVPCTEEECRNEGENHDDHHALDVDAVPYVRTALGGGVRDEHECLEGVECRMEESKLATFLKGRLDLVYDISCVHNSSSLSHFLDHEFNAFCDVLLDVDL